MTLYTVLALLVGLIIGVATALTVATHTSSMIVREQAHAITHAIYVSMGTDGLAWNRDKGLAMLRAECAHSRYKNNKAYDALDRLRRAVYAVEDMLDIQA
jgi:hypothetical protein